jgi:hypothetical protein
MVLQPDLFGARPGRLNACAEPVFGAGPGEVRAALAEPGCSIYWLVLARGDGVVWATLWRSVADLGLRHELVHRHGVLTTSPQQPTADHLRLPDLWLAVDHHLCRAECFSRTNMAGVLVRDQGLATAAQRLLQQIGASC